MNNNFVPTKDMQKLSRLSKAAILTSGDLMGLMLSELPKDKLEAVENLIKGGGRFGTEITTDAKGSVRVCLVGIEREGSRLTLATIETIGQGLPGVAH